MERGDHIKVRRKFFPIGYWHHGIYIGNGRVVHFTGEPKHKREAMIQETSLDYFLAGDTKWEIVEYKNSTQIRPPEEVVQVALNAVGTREYNLCFVNCENFATYCKTRKAYSTQVMKIANLTGSTAGSAVSYAATQAVQAAPSKAAIYMIKQALAGKGALAASTANPAVQALMTPPFWAALAAKVSPFILPLGTGIVVAVAIGIVAHKMTKNRLSTNDT